MKNPLLKFYRAQSSPAVSLSWDLLTGKDYIGDPTTDDVLSMSETVAKRFMYIWAQTIAFEGGTLIGRGQRGLAEFAGLRAYPRNRIWEATDLWRPDLKAYMDIPTDPLERITKGISVGRSEYRQAHPEIDAKLWITGEVTTLKSSAASSIVQELVKQYEIDPTDIKGVKKHQKAKVKQTKFMEFMQSGQQEPVRFSVSDSSRRMDRLIRALTMPETVAPQQGAANTQQEEALKELQRRAQEQLRQMGSTPVPAGAP
jgi:hypothetical protein